MTLETTEDRQARYLKTLRETGSHVRARAAAGVGARAVGKWRDNEAFADAEVEASEYALDSVVQASRAAALAGDSSQMTNWMRLAHAELRPSSSVNVGVAVGGTAKVDRSPEALQKLGEKLERARVEAELRGQTMAEYLTGAPARDVVDVEVLPAPLKPEDLL
jgi:hypothetical protein